MEAFYQRLASEGRERWQVEQADGALRLVYQKMYPADWARAWQPSWPEVAMTERPVNRERVADDPAWAGRSDVGDLPPRFESFLDELRRRNRAERDRLEGGAPSPEGAAGGRHQNQAFNALLFVFKEVLGQQFGSLEGVQRAPERRRVPMVLSREEVRRLLAA